jgi:hypothetical protein
MRRQDLDRMCRSDIDRERHGRRFSMASGASWSEEEHVYEPVSVLDDGTVIHLRCPECGKEVVRTLPAIDAVSSTGYRVLRDEHGALLQGDFSARHSWSMNMSLGTPGALGL